MYQAGRQWYTDLDKTLRNIARAPTNADACVYVDRDRYTFVLVYVDDILIISSDKKRERQIKCELSQKCTIKDLGRVKYCLVIEIRQDKERLCLRELIGALM